MSRFKKEISHELSHLILHTEDYMYKCENCDDLHFTAKAISIMLKNSKWYVRLGYKLGLVKF